jgi:hypothetical protein
MTTTKLSDVALGILAEQLARVVHVLGGGEVEGIRIGMPGVTREWLERRRADLEHAIATGEFRR